LPTHPESPPAAIIREFSKYIDPHSPNTFITATHRIDELDELVEPNANAIVNLRRINDVRRLNKFFEAAHAKLNLGGHFILCFETLVGRRERILAKYPVVISAPYFVANFALKRVLPKLPLTKQIYFGITQGRNRLLSRAETLGRLYSCGFEVLELKHIDHLLFVVARKTRPPNRETVPSYGPVFKMRRLGYQGQPINVYKFRTMYPYSEYLQEYVYRQQALDDGGKFKDDFRVTRWGRVFRRYWLDEIPMIVNLFTGDLKLVGVRPLSMQYESLYPDSLREERRKVLPGLIPPFYADLPKSFEEILESEKRYLEAYRRRPLLTDLRYLARVLRNIVVKGARSA
jgi:lipopolysaccharide/colanic/teichoic acid biosynthesis glycosyltransferase